MGTPEHKSPTPQKLHSDVTYLSRGGPRSLPWGCSFVFINVDCDLANSPYPQMPLNLLPLCQHPTDFLWGCSLRIPKANHSRDPLQFISGDRRVPGNSGLSSLASSSPPSGNSAHLNVSVSQPLSATAVGVSDRSDYTPFTDLCPHSDVVPPTLLPVRASSPFYPVVSCLPFKVKLRDISAKPPTSETFGLCLLSEPPLTSFSALSAILYRSMKCFSAY